MKAQEKDYIDKKYNKLLIVKLEFNNGKTYANCKCDCGKSTRKLLSMIKVGHITSCGCEQKKTLFTKNTNRIIYNNFSCESEESCYWAGFLFGDGCIDKHNKLQICLGLKSLQHLRLLSQFLFKQDYVTIYKDKCILQVTDENISKYLKKYGIIPRKTYNSSLILPSKPYIKDFIRGYFDADGWIGTSHNFNKKYKTTYISHNLGLCSYLPENLEKITRYFPVYKPPRKINNKDLYEVRYYKKKEIIDIATWLYHPILKLNYKWDVLCQLMNS